MRAIDTEIADIKLISFPRFRDDRGWFQETFRQDLLAVEGILDLFVQDNQSFSVRAGTVRGLHYQTPPYAQAKLVRVVAGSIVDVAVDLRRASPSYGRHVALRLDAAEGAQLYLPVGFAHGFCTLEDNTLVTYKVGAPYSRAHDRSIRWNDPDLGIPWPVSESSALLSEKDRTAPRLRDVEPVF